MKKKRIYTVGCQSVVQLGRSSIGFSLFSPIKGEAHISLGLIHVRYSSFAYFYENNLYLGYLFIT